VVDTSGQVVGRHGGIGKYTIGQRRGLGIAAGKPIYVTELNVAANTVTVGDDDALLRPALVAGDVNYLIEPLSEPFRAAVKIRYLHEAAPATVYPLSGARARVVFDKPQRAITPGQAVVFYDGDVVIGGGWIDRSETEPPRE
jgi:tRNA-specific 2-thiouridylase